MVTNLLDDLQESIPICGGIASILEVLVAVGVDEGLVEVDFQVF